MRQVFLSYREAEPIVQQLVGQIPRGHNLLLLARVKEPKKRVWYLEQTATQGWSRAVLDHHISRSSHRNRSVRASPARRENAQFCPNSAAAIGRSGAGSQRFLRL
jgi:predicted nuclease of restriction endonuclease-like (RecB) superfamily